MKLLQQLTVARKIWLRLLVCLMVAGAWIPQATRRTLPKAMADQALRLERSAGVFTLAAG